MADARRKKAIVFNKDDLRRGADDIRREFENIKSSGMSSARGVQEAFEGLGKRAKTALNEAFDGNSFKGLKDIEESLKIQRKAVDDLAEQYKKAKAEFDSVNLGTQDEALIAKREKASTLYRQVKSELEGETNLLNKQEEAFKLISTELQTAGDKSVTFYTQMRQIREEMNKLALAGQDQTPRYDELRSKLDEVSVAYRKVQQEQQMLAKYGNMLIPGLIQGISGLAGAFSVYQGVASMFAKDNESLAEIQTKLQRAMALTIGLQQVQQTLHSTSKFRMGVVRKATQAWEAAQKALNTSLGIGAGLSKALVTGGVMALVAGVGYLITKYREWSREQEKLRDTVKSYTDALSNEKAQLDYLFDTYKKAEEGTKAYKDAKKEIIDQLDKYYGGLNSEKLLVEDTAEAYNKLSAAIQNSAKEKALQETYESLAKEAIETQSDAYTNLYDKIITKIGDEKGSKLFARIRKEIEEQGRLSESLISDINSEDSFYRRDLKSDRKTGSSWIEKTDFNEVYELAQTAIKKTTKAQEEYNAEVKKARSILSSLGAESTKIDNSSKSIIDSLRKEREAILKLPETTEEEIKAKNRKLQVIDEEIKRLESLGKVEQRGTGKATTFEEAKEKQALQEIRAAEDLEIQINEAEINAMDEGAEKVLAQMELNYKKRKQALERQKEDALRTKRDNARSVFESDPNNKDKAFDDSVIRLTEEELKKFQDLQIKLTANFEKEKYSLELQYMRDYISEYGTFQQKKLLIAQEYDKKIAASHNEWEKKSLESQKQRDISNIDFKAVSKQIDWQGVFGNMTGMLESQLKETLSGLKEYVKTDQFKLRPETDKKTIYEAIDKLNSVMPEGQGTLNFNEIQRQMDDLGAAINRFQKATIDDKTASENLVKAQKEYENALKFGNEAIIEGARQALEVAKSSASEASSAYKSAESDVENLGNSFRETAVDTVDGLNFFADGLHNFASNSLPAIFEGFQDTVSGLSKLNIGGKIGDAVGTLSKTLSSAGFIGQIISAILSILDILKDGIGTLISGLIDTVLNAIDGILENLLSGELFVQIFNSLKDGIGNILNTLSYGGFNKLTYSISGSNAKETAEIISKLTSSNEALKVSVDALREEIAGTNGAKSVQAYNEAVNAQQRYNENLREILDAQMGYHSSHHSNAYYWDLNRNSLNEVNKLLGTSLKNSWSDFSKLTPDQMNEIRTHLPDIWSEMISQGKYGDRFKEDWDNYADQAGKVIEMTESLRENIAQISFDSLRDSFVNALMDMDSDAKDFAGNFEEYMTKALLNFAVGDLLDDQMKEWYESWVDTINKQDGKLTDQQIAQYKKEWDAMVQMGIEKRDEIASLTGYTGKDGSMNQQASVGVTKTASQDSIDVLDGRLTHVQETNQEISNNSNAILEQMRTSFTTLNEQMETSRNITLQSMYHLADISKNTNELYAMNKTLQRIDNNTKGL